MFLPPAARTAARRPVGVSPPPPPSPPPGAPQDFTATALGPTQIALSWAAPPRSSETKTWLERSADGGSTWALVQDVPTLTTGTIDSCLAPETTYTYRAAHRPAASSGGGAVGSYCTPDAATTESLGAVGARAVLSADDFQYLGYYDHDIDGQTAYVQGLTCRYVGGQLRLLMFYFLGNIEGNQFAVEEYAVPGSFGSSLGSRTGYWADVWNGQNTPNSFHYIGLDWDESAERLWVSSANYYPQAPLSQTAVTAISRCQLNGDGSISDFKGFWGFEGVGQRAVYGGTLRVPAWFAAANSTGPYMHGFGGGHSLSDQGLFGAMGPLFVFPDYDISADPGEAWGSETHTVAAADFRFGADTRSGVTGDAYWSAGSFASRTYDRGVKIAANIQNFFDDGGYPQNPSAYPAGTVTAVANTTPVQITYAHSITAGTDIVLTGQRITIEETGIPALDGNQFTVTRVDSSTFTLDGTTAAGTSSTGVWFMSAPSAVAYWTSPAPGDPDGYGRQTWGDSYFNNVCWVDDDAGTRTRHGIVAVGSFQAGKACYIGSAGYYDTFTAELHVYDPAHVAECLAGTREPFDVRPVVAVTLSLPGTGATESTFYSRVRGACFDPTTNRLFMVSEYVGANNYYRGRVYVFQVRGS